MKRILLLILLCLAGLCSLTAHAQSIIGSWTTDGRELLGLADDGTFKKAYLIFTFNQNGTATMAWDMAMVVNEEGMMMDMGINVAMSGTYTKRGQEVMVDFDKEKTTVDFYKFDIKLGPVMERALADAGMTKADIVEMVKSQMDVKQMTSGIECVDGTLYIRTLTATQLVLCDGEDGEGETLSLTRVVKK